MHVRVELAREPFQIRFISSHPRLRRFASRVASRIRRYIPETGRTFSPYRFAAESVFYSLATSPLIVTALVLARLINPFFLVLAAVPFISLAVPWARIRTWIGDRKRSIEEELPFFAIHASILQSAGRDLYNALLSTIGRGVFHQIERDAAIMRRNTTYFRMGPLEGIEELGRTNPNPRMRSLLLGYSSEWRSGGDAARYLERKTDDYLKDTEARWERYVERVSYAGELAVALLFLCPLLVLFAVFLAPGTGEWIAEIFLAFALPLLVTAGVSVIRSSQPKSYDRLEGSPWVAILVGIACAAAAWNLSAPTWLCLVFGLGAAGLAHGIPVVSQMREIRAHESALPRFLRDETEYQKLGYDLVKGTIKISGENEYNPKFDRLLRYVAKQLGLGHRFSEIRIPTRSWLTRMAFFHLGEVAESGAYQTRSLELLTDFVGGVLRTRRKARTSMHLYRALSMATPLCLALVVGLLVGLLGSLSGFTVTEVAVPGGLPMVLWTVSPLLLALSQATILASAVGIALLASYATDFTLLNTTWISLNLALAGIGIWISGPIASAVGGFI